MVDSKLSYKQIKENLLLKEVETLGLTNQIKFLEENGFKKLSKNIKFLLEANSDQAKALEHLKERNNKKHKHSKEVKQHYKKHIKCYDKNSHHYSERQERVLKEIETKGLKSANEFLISHGYNNFLKNLKAIETTKSQEEALKYLQDRKTGSKKEEKKAKAIEELKTLGFTSQNEYLVSKGFDNVTVNLKALKKNEGDKVKVEAMLQEKYEKRALKKALKAEKGPKISDEEKKAKKLLKEKQRQSKHDIGKMVLHEFPSTIDTVYLDGNNMLFVDGSIRKFCLSKKRKEAENLVSSLSQETMKAFGVKTCVLVYDLTNNVYDCNSDNLKMTVCSASPNFKTSDDALVGWMEGKSALDNICVVTSDLGLQIRLKDKGIKHLMKSGAYFKIAKAKLGDEKYDSIVKKEETDK